MAWWHLCCHVRGAQAYPETLFLDSRVFADQRLNERAQQCFTPLLHVVNEREETQGEWPFFLCNAPMRAQPTAQERPKAFHRGDMHVAKAVALFIAGVLTPAMVDALMIIAPCLKTRIHTVLVRVHQGT